MYKVKKRIKILGGLIMRKTYFAISYIDDDGTKHLATAQEEWEVRFYQRRFYNVSVSTFKVSF